MAQVVRNNERGLTLLETVVALAIIFIVFLGLTDAGLLVTDYNINNAIRDEAVRVADTEMATVRQTPYSVLFAKPEGTPLDSPNGEVVTRQIRGLTEEYHPTWTLTHLGSDLQVTVDVTWQRNAWTPSGRVLRTYSHQATTIVRNP